MPPLPHAPPRATIPAGGRGVIRAGEVALRLPLHDLNHEGRSHAGCALQIDIPHHPFGTLGETFELAVQEPIIHFSCGDAIS